MNRPIDPREHESKYEDLDINMHEFKFINWLDAKMKSVIDYLFDKFADNLP